MVIYEGAQPYVFLSYAHMDSGRVLPIFRKLEEGNYRIWYDGSIEAGTEWSDYIAEHLEKSGCFLAFLSKNYLNSQNCKQEINYALDLDIPILVVYMEDVTLTGGLRMRLGMVQALFYHHYRSDAAFLADLFRSTLLTPCLESGRNQFRGQVGRSESAVVPPTRPVSTGGPAAYRAPSSFGHFGSSTSSFSYKVDVFANDNNNSVVVGETSRVSRSGWGDSNTSTVVDSSASIVIRSGQIYKNPGVLQGATVERGGTLINVGIISRDVHLAGGTLQNSGTISGSVTGTGVLENKGIIAGHVSSDVTHI